MESNQEPKPSCAINGVFVMGRAMAACSKHGGENKCYDTEPCEHKIPAEPEEKELKI